MAESAISTLIEAFTKSHIIVSQTIKILIGKVLEYKELKWLWWSVLSLSKTKVKNQNKQTEKNSKEAIIKLVLQEKIRGRA